MEFIAPELEEVLIDTADKTLALLFYACANDNHLACTDVEKGIVYKYDEDYIIF